jgi:hypothetical protein
MMPQEMQKLLKWMKNRLFMNIYGVVGVVILPPKISVVVINVHTGIADPVAIGASGALTITSYTVIATTRDTICKDNATEPKS